MAEKIRVGALVSGGGTNLQAIIDACDANRIDAKVIFVGSDNPRAYGLERAKKHGIPTFVVDYQAVMEKAGGGLLEEPVPKDLDLEVVLSKQGIAPALSEREKVKAYFFTRAIAEAAMLRALEVEPTNIDYLYALADHYLKRGDLELALEVAERMIATHPENDIGNQMKSFIEAELEPAAGVCSRWAAGRGVFPRCHRTPSNPIPARASSGSRR